MIAESYCFPPSIVTYVWSVSRKPEVPSSTKRSGIFTVYRYLAEEGSIVRLVTSLSVLSEEKERGLFWSVKKKKQTKTDKGKEKQVQ